MGKYGALLLMEKTSEPLNSSGPPFIELGRRLCQHVVGMYPKSVGTLDDYRALEAAKAAAAAEAAATAAAAESSSSSSSSDEDSSGSDDEEMKPKKAVEEEAEETVMLRQEFLLDSSIRVGQLTQESGVTILDFARFECGEVLPEDEEI